MIVFRPKCLSFWPQTSGYLYYHMPLILLVLWLPLSRTHQLSIIVIKLVKWKVKGIPLSEIKLECHQAAVVLNYC